MSVSPFLSNRWRSTREENAKGPDWVGDHKQPTCSYCRSRATQCVYQTARRASRKVTEADLERRLRHMESLYQQLREHTTLLEGRRSQKDIRLAGVGNNSPSPPQSSVPATEPSAIRTSIETDEAANTTPFDVLISSENPINPIYSRSPSQGSIDAESPWKSVMLESEDLVDSILWKSKPGIVHDNGASVTEFEFDEEYIGPCSSLSMLSHRGLRWVSERLGSAADLHDLRDLTRSLASQMKIPQNLEGEYHIGSEKQLPVLSVARTYATAYFNFAQSIIPVVSPTTFDAAFEKMSKGEPVDDPAWYGLYNAILAVGCRATLSANSPASFKESEQEAWGYFSNALRVQTELLYMRAGLMSAQALCVMALFAHGISSPQLEYMLCSQAAHVAQAKGLHKEPSGVLFSLEEVEERSNLFWSIYTLDKSMMIRIGRPSAIDDNDISCPFPHPSLRQDPKPCEDKSHTFLQATRLGRICSKIKRGLYSPSALNTPIERLVDVRDTLEKELWAWQDTLPDLSHPQKPFRASRMGPHVHLNQALFLRFCYFDAVSALHRRFSASYLFSDDHCDYPSPSNKLEAWKKDSVLRNVETARQTILLTRHIEVESYTPNWLLIYFPLTALMTLFTYIISEPQNASAPDDVALMEVVTGLFSHLKFLSSGLKSLDEAKAFVRLAQLAIKNARSHEPEASSNARLEDTNSQETPNTGSDIPGVMAHARDREMNGVDLAVAWTYPGAEEPHSLLTPVSQAVQEFLQYDSRVQGGYRMELPQREVSPSIFFGRRTSSSAMIQDDSGELNNGFNMDYEMVATEMYSNM